ncbi:hypothetical protein EOD40_04855 [Flavobacterium sufflavum]|uniref:Uncharacterized protein n=1 Tax=Flavobacterium sufflavum TaxID=1921138 RepID=A0A437L0R2_9FLAO|nr:hypothetical protein [Flavobacterium sufflavum]RVT78566.1 hypothetical protein EOD40_04855 [Flavobacterium sufflavum]
MFTKVRSQKLEVRSENGKVKILFSIFCFLFSMFFSLTTNAQCAMCRAALGGDANVEKAKAVNDGIVYLMVIPYLLVAVIGYFVYRMKKNKTK